MAQSMRRFGQGELSIQTPIYASDELGYLGETFNRMTGQIRDLIDEISTTEKLKSEAELKALHYQINPHLLFNTLNSIQWKARLAGQTDILKMLEHLVAVLEGSFNVKQVLVPLHTELEIIHHYLQMQRYRYGDVLRIPYRSNRDLRSVWFRVWCCSHCLRTYFSTDLSMAKVISHLRLVPRIITFMQRLSMTAWAFERNIWHSFLQVKSFQGKRVGLG